MSALQYHLQGVRSPEDGRFRGTLTQGSTVVATSPDDGFRKESDLESWARGAAEEHKWSTTPPDEHLVSRKFAV